MSTRFPLCYYGEGGLNHGPRSINIDKEGKLPEKYLMIDPDHKNRIILSLNDKITIPFHEGNLHEQLKIMKKLSKEFFLRHSEPIEKNTKKLLPCISQPIGQLETGSGILFRFRRINNIPKMYSLIYDFDNENPNNHLSKNEINLLIKKSKYESLSYDSISSSNEKSKCRVIFPLSKPIDNYVTFKRVYTSFLKHLLGDKLFNSDIAAGRGHQLVDIACQDITRVFFLTTPERLDNAIIYIGEPINPDDYDNDNYYTIGSKKTRKPNTKVKDHLIVDHEEYIFKKKEINWERRDSLLLSIKKSLKNQHRNLDQEKYFEEILKELIEKDASQTKNDSNLNRLKDLVLNNHSQSEPDWRSSILEFLIYGKLGGDAFLEFMERKIHAYSEKYDGYEPEHTDQKIVGLLAFIESEYQLYININRKSIKYKLNPTYIEPELLSPSEAAYLLEGIRKNTSTLTYKSMNREYVLLNSSDPSTGKTYSTVLAAIDIFKKGQRVVWSSSQYPALQNAKEYFMELGIPEHLIIFIPQPVGFNKNLASYQFNCIRFNKLKKMRKAGINYTKHLCSKKGDPCPMASTCPLLCSRKQAEKSKNEIIMFHSSYFKTKFPEKVTTNAHLIIDEPNIMELLREVKIPQHKLKKFEVFLNNLPQYFDEAKMPFINICRSLQKMINKTEKAIIIKTDFIAPKPEDIKLLKWVMEKNVVSNINKKITPPPNLIETIVQLTQTKTFIIINNRKNHTFTITFNNPYPLQTTKSITLLDAAGIPKKNDLKTTLEKCGKIINKKTFYHLHYQNHLTEPIHQVICSNYPRYSFKKQNQTKLFIQILKLLNLNKSKNLALLTYKQDPIKLPGLEYLFKKLKKYTNLITPPNFYFHGNLYGIDPFKHLSKAEKQDTLLIILGTPRSNEMEILTIAHHLDILTPDSELPVFDKNNSPFIKSGSHYLKNAFFHQKPIRNLEIAQISEELIQCMGRGAFRGIKTVLFTNIPIRTKTFIKKSTLQEMIGKTNTKRELNKLNLQQLVLKAKIQHPKLTREKFLAFLENIGKIKKYSKRLIFKVLSQSK